MRHSALTAIVDRGAETAEPTGGVSDEPPNRRSYHCALRVAHPLRPPLVAAKLGEDRALNILLHFLLRDG